jgi:nucleoside-diphosphate-sugar epimerase
LKVLVAGGTGAVGRPLVRQLEEAGHEAVGVGRSSQPVAMDALDAISVREAVGAVKPEVIVNQLTAIPDPIDPRKMEQQFEPTNRLRREGTANLMAAAKEHGVRRVISQSIAFAYAPTDGGAWREEDRLMTEAGEIFQAVEDLERQTLGTEGVEGVVLRYGFFYGPGTTYAPGGGTAAAIKKRQFPIIGKGTGVFHYIHVEDAAGATVAALDHGAPGIYNVVDDEHAPLSESLPALAEALGAKPPRRVPKFIGRLAAGKMVVRYATALQPASNEKAKRELGWHPRYPSWRQGFREALG